MRRRRLSGTLLKWILIRRGQSVACQVDRIGKLFRVSIHRLGYPEHRRVELYDATATAFQRDECSGVDPVFFYENARGPGFSDRAHTISEHGTG